MNAPKLEGRRILLVEDEYFQAREIRGYLEHAGMIVIGPTGYADEVSALLAAEQPDAALVDINLGTGANYETARILKDQGVPFAFFTGYDQAVIPAEMGAVPRLEKPATEKQVIHLLNTLI